MTEKEWNSYDSDAEIINGQEFNSLSPTRQTAIANKLYKTQGHYGKTAMAPGWLGPGAKVALGLKRYLPGYYWALALRHSRISDLANSGILPSLMLLRKVMKYNLSPESIRAMEFNEAKLKKMASEGVPDILLFEKSVKDAFQKILQENTNNTGRIKWSELSDNDRSNIKTTIRAIGLYAVSALALAALGGGGGDDEKIRTKIGKGLLKVVSRFQNDIFMIQGPQSLTDQLKRLATPVAFDMIYAAGKAATSTIAMLKYGYSKATTGLGEGKDKALYINAPNAYIPEGFPRMVVDILKIAPGGNAITQVWQMEENIRLHFKFMPEDRFDNTNIDDTMMDVTGGNKTGLRKIWADMVWEVFANKNTDSHVNEYDFRTAQTKFDAESKLINDYEAYRQLMVEGSDKETVKAINEYFQTQEANKEINKEARMYANLANNIRKVQEYENEGITREDMLKGQQIYLTLKKNAAIGTPETKIRKAILQNYVTPTREEKSGIRNLMKGSLEDIYGEVNQ